MKKKLLLFALLLCCGSLCAQNILTNGNFEDYDYQPPDMGEAEAATAWDNVIRNADYIYVPTMGGNCHDGSEGCMGLTSYGNEDADSEAIGQNISANPLLQDTLYYIEFFARSDRFAAPCQGIDLVGFAENPGSDLINVHPLDLPGAVHIYSTEPILSSQFVKYTGLFTPTADINYLTFSATESECYHYFFLDDMVIEKPKPFDLEADTTACAGDTVRLEIDLEDAEFLWTNGSTEAGITVTESGVYYVEVLYDNVTYLDSTEVIFTPLPTVDLGPDRVACRGNGLRLDAEISGAESFVWNTGATASFIFAGDTGAYFVTASNGNCTVADTVFAEFIDLPDDLFADLPALCPDSTLLLDATYPEASYVWQDGSTLPTFTARTPGDYAVTVTVDECSEEYTAAVAEQIFDCKVCNLYIPSAFSPNFDGYNDRFTPFTNCTFAEYNLTIFDRWGNLLFVSADPGDTWDGRVNDRPADDGVYVISMQYRFAEQRKSEIYRGDVIILR